MRGLLIYDEAGKRRNEWFINRLIEAAAQRGCTLELLIYKCEDDKKRISGYDFAIVRTINPELGEYIEALGIPCFNNSRTSLIANDKWQTYTFANELGIPVMQTIKTDVYDEAKRVLGVPFVLKTVDGHGGSEVYLVENEQKCKELCSLLKEKDYIMQKMCSEPGVDMRVYVLGGEILAAAKRTSKSDFRSNFSLGGNAEIGSVDSDVSEVVAKVYRELSCDFTGIDFIRHEGKWILNEIEDVVGTRMLYTLTDIDAADKYIEYITARLKR